MDAGVQGFFHEVFHVKDPLEHGQGSQIRKINPLVVVRGTTTSPATYFMKCHRKSHCGYMLVRGNTLLYPGGHCRGSDTDIIHKTRLQSRDGHSKIVLPEGRLAVRWSLYLALH